MDKSIRFSEVGNYNNNLIGFFHLMEKLKLKFKIISVQHQWYFIFSEKKLTLF